MGMYYFLKLIIQIRVSSFFLSLVFCIWLVSISIRALKYSSFADYLAIFYLKKLTNVKTQGDEDPQ